MSSYNNNDYNNNDYDNSDDNGRGEEHLNEENSLERNRDNKPLPAAEIAKNSANDMLANMFKDAAEKLRSQRKMHVYTDLKPAEGHSQGDVMVQYLGESIFIPDGHLGLQLKASIPASNDTDVVVSLDPEGDQESHMLRISSGKAVNVWRFPSNNPLVGDVIQIEEGSHFDVEHHEHATARFAKAGWYVVRFPRGYTQGDQVQQIAQSSSSASSTEERNSVQPASQGCSVDRRFAAPLTRWAD